MGGSDGMKPVAVEVKEDGTTAKVLAKEATLSAISTAQTDKSQFTKITDGTDTWLIDSSGRGLVAGNQTPPTLLNSSSNPTDAQNIKAHLLGQFGGVWYSIGALNVSSDGQATTGLNAGLLTSSVLKAINGAGQIDRLRSVNTGQLVVTLKDSTGVEPIDSSTNSLVVIDEAHHELHDGNHFTVQDIQSVGAASTFYYQITAPNTTKRIHFEFFIQSSGNGLTINIFEAPTTSAGTSLTAYNRNRNSATSATATVVHTPTVTSTGTTTIHQDYIPAGVNRSGETRSENEFVLKQNTKYLIRYVTDAGAGATVVTHLEWYEE